MDEEVKNCPFCGGLPEVVSVGADTFYVVCTKCGAGTSIHDRENVIKQWNMRVVSPNIIQAFNELICMACCLCERKTCNGKGDCSGIVNAKKALAELQGE